MLNQNLRSTLNRTRRTAFGRSLLSWSSPSLIVVIAALATNGRAVSPHPPNSLSAQKARVCSCGTGQRPASCGTHAGQCGLYHVLRHHQLLEFGYDEERGSGQAEPMVVALRNLSVALKGTTWPSQTSSDVHTLLGDDAALTKVLRRLQGPGTQSPSAWSRSSAFINGAADLAVDTDGFLTDLGFPIGPAGPSKGESFPDFHFGTPPWTEA